VSIGFKEWTLVCEALGAAVARCAILRKGGIAEGRDGFRFQHPDFLLLPTLFHEQVSKLKSPPETSLPQHVPGQHADPVSCGCGMDARMNGLGTGAPARSISFVVGTNDPVNRFLYDQKEAVSLAFLRVFRLSRPFEFPDAAKYGGCRSWVDLPDVPEGIGFESVLEM